MRDRHRGLIGRLPVVVVGLAWLYCVIIVYFAIVWTILPEKFWWIAFTNLFAPLFFLPLLVFLPLSVLIRTRRMLIAAFIPAAVFLLLFGGLFLPRFPQVIAAAQPVRVLTLNQFFGNQQYDALINAIRDGAVDVVALQELSPAVATRLEQQLGEEFPYRWLLPADHAGGIGVISRYPIVDQQHLLNGRAQQVTLQLDHGPLTLVNVHLHFNSLNRHNVIFWGDTPLPVGYDSERVAAQVQMLLTEIEGIKEPLVIVGDFNMGDREPGYRILRETFRDAFRDAGWGFGFTFPNHKSFGPLTVPLPVVRLDYTLLRGPVTAGRAELDCRPIGADHCMLRTELYVTPR